MMTRDGGHQRVRVHERGVALVMIGIWLMVLLGLAGLAVDLAHVVLHKTWLQATADAAALAGVYELPSDASSVVQRVSEQNYSDGGTVVAGSDIQPGRWDAQTASFAAGAQPPNALRVTARRATVNDNPLQTIIMGAFGFPIADLSAVAIATRNGGDDRLCFLIDDEMIDSDISVIQALASSLGKSPDAIIRDGNGDRFIDLPPGTELELPTGQTGDEALFEPQSAFPFSPHSTPFGLEDFLVHQDGTGPIPDDMLDPLEGVKAVAQPGDYPSFVDPDQICVAPVYKSDVSRLGPPENAEVNAKGERRGLLAFTVLRVGADPDGAGSRLPNLVIRVHDPAQVALAEVVLGSTNGLAKLVR